MIDLTPIEIRKKKGDFTRSVRGYNVAEVDLFLDLTADRLEEAILTARAAEERIAQLEEELAGFRQREKSMTAALISAEKLRDEVARQAEREAELIRRGAEADAEAARRAAFVAIEREQEVLRRLRARRSQLLESLRSLLERELSELAVLTESFAGEPELLVSGEARLDEIFSDRG